VNVLFVCVGNTGRSLMAERLFRRAAEGRHDVRSAGSSPGEGPEPTVLAALREIGIDARDHRPRRLDDAALAWADLAVSLCREEVCPVTPGARRISWAFDDPWGRPIDEVRAIRDAIDVEVTRLAAELAP
jgi:protein-tyrosine-phosphatase